MLRIFWCNFSTPVFSLLNNNSRNFLLGYYFPIKGNKNYNISAPFFSFLNNNSRNFQQVSHFPIKGDKNYNISASFFSLLNNSSRNFQLVSCFPLELFAIDARISSIYVSYSLFVTFRHCMVQERQADREYPERESTYVRRGEKDNADN